MAVDLQELGRAAGNVGMLLPADRQAHADKAWAHFRALGSPKFHVAPMVDQVGRAELKGRMLDGWARNRSPCAVHAPSAAHAATSDPHFKPPCYHLFFSLQSELPFRMLCRSLGCSAAYTPMLHARIFAQVGVWPHSAACRLMAALHWPCTVPFTPPPISIRRLECIAPVEFNPLLATLSRCHCRFTAASPQAPPCPLPSTWTPLCMPIATRSLHQFPSQDKHYRADNLTTCTEDRPLFVQVSAAACTLPPCMAGRTSLHACAA